MNDGMNPSPESEETELEATQDFEEPLIEPEVVEELEEAVWRSKLPKLKYRQLRTDDQGNTYLVIKTIQTRRVGKLRKKQYQVEISEILLKESSRVEPSLATKLDFKPVYGETTIHVLARRSWWERGPSQVGLLVLSIFATLSLAYVGTTTSVTTPQMSFVAWILLTLVIAVSYFIVWMKWAYQYFVITNRRLGLIYCPPFSLPGTRPFSPISNITVNEANDQSWFANLLGRINPAYSYGKLNYDTPAQEDKWMSEIKFIREYKAVNEIVSSLIVQAEQQIETVEQRDSRELQDRYFRLKLIEAGEEV